MKEKNNIIEDKDIRLDDELDNNTRNDDFKDDLDQDLSQDSFEDDNDGRMDLIRQLTSFDKDIKEMVIGWLGYEWDENEKSFVKSDSIKPICNTHCAAWCTNHLRTYLRQTNSLINPTEKDYDEIIEDNINLIWGTFGTEHKKFGFETTSDMEKVYLQLMHSIRLLLSSTRHGGIKNLIKETHQQNEKINDEKRNIGIMERASNFLNRLGGR